MISDFDLATSEEQAENACSPSPLEGQELALPPPVLQTARIVSALAATAGSAELTAMSCLFAATSAAALDGFAVEMPNTKTIKPVGLMMCLSAPSGCRKSTTYNLIAKPLARSEAAFGKKNDLEQRDYAAQLVIHKAELKKKTKQLERASDEESESLKQQIMEMEATKPVEPKKNRRIVSNSTLEGIYRHYKEVRQAPYVHADEGKQALALLSRNAAILSKFYDGESQNVERGTAETVEIRSPKISALFMVQPGILRSHIKTHGAQSLDSGLFARMLFVNMNEAGEGFIPWPFPYQEWYVQEIHKRLDALLAQSNQVADGLTEQKVMTLSEDAAAMWYAHVGINQDVINKNNDMSESTRAYFSRLSENLLRLAAIIQLIELPCWDGPITGTSMSVAISYIDVFKDQYLRMFEFGEMEQDYNDEKALLIKLQKTFWNWNIGLTKSQIHKVAPRIFRGNIKRLDRALEALIQNNTIITQVSINPVNEKNIRLYAVNKQAAYIGR